MDFSFHLQQGQKLLEKQDAQSMEKALQHFRTANEITEDGHIGKPRTLYYLAIGNLLIGNIEHAYKIAHKAKKSIDFAIENSAFVLNNMRQMVGENDIDNLIQQIEENYGQHVLLIDVDEYFDENFLDFSLISQIYPAVEKQTIIPQFSLDHLSDELLMAVYAGMSRNDDDLVYFDILKGDVLSYVEGYFSSHLGDQEIAGKLLTNKIINGEQRDFVDEERYLLIDRMLLIDFLKEFKKQVNGLEPFSSFVDFFSLEILKEFEYNIDLKVEDIYNSSFVQKKFHEFFSRRYQDRVLELRKSYLKIFEDTCKTLAKKWIIENNQHSIFNEEDGSANISLDFIFKSSDHLRYENGKHISGPHGGANRAIKVEPNINGNEGFTIALYNLDGNHPFWQNNVQMAPKQMKIIESNNNTIVFRGYGHDPLGNSFSDYGLTVNFKEGELENCILHMHDRNVDILYLP